MKTRMFAIVFFLISSGVQADDLKAEIFAATLDGAGPQAGVVSIKNSEHGAVFSLRLTGLDALSSHGFHVHAKGSCAPAEKNGKMVPAFAAGGHWDPDSSGKHSGPLGGGHKGDLPLLQADKSGNINKELVATNIHDTRYLKGHALIIHANGDNYADMPKKLGGGGARMFCGIIK
jgi:superoxide dismutase, Cu-Zn family